MADADTNQTTSTPAAGSTGGGGGTTTTTARAATPSTAPAAQAATADKAKKAAREQKYYVDGRAVSKEEYLKAAEGAGWNPDHLRERNYYPAVSTAKK